MKTYTTGDIGALLGMSSGHIRNLVDKHLDSDTKYVYRYHANKKPGRRRITADGLRELARRMQVPESFHKSIEDYIQNTGGDQKLSV